MIMAYANGEGGSDRPLFGGAMMCFLPNNASDVSLFREVPDNQEVFCHKDSDQSMMIDLLEYQAAVQGENAVRYHFNDIAEANDATAENEVVNIEHLSKDHLQFMQCTEAWFLSGHQMVSKFKEETEAKNLIDIHMALFRLPQYSTDVVLVMNDPVAISTQSSSSHSNERSKEYWTIETFKHAVATLRLVDPGLFG